LGRKRPEVDPSARRSELDRREPRAPVSRGDVRCGVCRDEAGNHFENRIRELQTSVEWTGVATGLRPTQTRKTRREPRALRRKKRGRLPSLPDPLARVTSRKDESWTAPMGGLLACRTPKGCGRKQIRKPRRGPPGDQNCRVPRARMRALRDRYDERRRAALGLRRATFGVTAHRKVSGRGSTTVGDVLDVPARGERALPLAGSAPQYGWRVASRLGAGA
jgi:hypothetical protein